MIIGGIVILFIILVAVLYLNIKIDDRFERAERLKDASGRLDRWFK
jgi:hypothetical protein